MELRWTRNLLWGYVAAFALSPALAKDHETLSPDLGSIHAGQSYNVIVQYRQQGTAAHQQRISDLHGTVKGIYQSVPAMTVNVPASALSTLRNDPDVVYISPDRRVTRMNADYFAEPINAPQAWKAGYDGTGVGVVIIDSGVTADADLNWSNAKGWYAGKNGFPNRVVYSESFVPGDPSTTDAYGHGSHVAGLVAGNGADSTGPRYFRTFKGVAPGAYLVNLKVLDKNGEGTDAAVIAAIDRAIQLKQMFPQANLRVMNLSLGRPVYESYKTDPLCQAVEQAYKAGFVVVTAAGNFGRSQIVNTEGYGTVTAPGNDPYVLTVGSMRSMQTPSALDDRIASYSSKGPALVDGILKPDIVAPGNLVPSILSPNSTLAQLSLAQPLGSLSQVLNWTTTSSVLLRLHRRTTSR